jgi:hypothetical protein
MSKGPSSAPAPTSQTVNQTNLPAWAQPYSEKLLGQAEALTDVNTNPYQQYTGQRVADFTPAQQQAFSSIQNMQTAPQLGQGTDLARASGIGSIAAGQQYGQQATDPSAVSRYMNPYLQNTLNPAMQLLNQQYGIAGQQQRGGATKSGAFGGNRETLANSLNQQNQMLAQNQLVGGAYNQAYNTANQNMQTAAAQGLQGYGQANTAAGTLGQLGQNQYNQQMGIANAQQGVGAQQQALNQQNLTNKYQDFLNKANYPYQQMGFMSDILHGTPTGGITTTQTSQASPSMANQIMGYGLGAAGISNLVKGAKEGGVIRGYKEGGAVQHFAGGGITSGMSLEAQFNLAKMMRPQQLDAIAKGQQHSEITAAVAAAALPLATQNQTAASGIEAQSELAQNQGKSVIDRMMEGRQDAVPIPGEETGIAALKADNMNDVVQAAEGGIIGYADGGNVKHFQNRGSTDEDAYNRWRKENPFIPDTDAQLLNRRTDLEDAFGTAIDATAAGAKKLNRAVIDPLNAIGRFTAAPVMGGLRMLGINAPSPYPANVANTNAPVGPAPTSAQMQANQGPYDVGLPASSAAAAAPAATSAPRNNAPRTAAAPQGGVSDLVAPQVRDMFSVMPQKAEAAADSVAALKPEARGTPPTSGLADFISQMQGTTKSYTDKQADLIKQLNPTAEDKASRNNDRRGIAFLTVGSSLLRPGDPNAARADALEKIGVLAEKYGQEDKADKRTQIGAQIALLGAQAQLAQGDTKMGVDLFQHGEKMNYEYARIEAEKTFKQVDQDLKRQGLSEEVRRNKATEAAKGVELEIMAKYRADMGQYYKAMGGAAGGKGGMTPALREKAADNVRSMLSKPAQREALKQRPEFKGMTDTEIESALFTQELAKIAGGLGGLGSLAGAGAFENPAFGQGPAPQGATIRPLVPAKS